MGYEITLLPLFILVVCGWLLFGCSDLREPTPTNLPPELSVHPANWLIKTSPEFHGQFIRDTNWDWDACKSCHGENFQGGISEVACSACHRTIPHPNGWIVPNSDNFHGKAIRQANWQMGDCQDCHGKDYNGATTGVACLTCHPATPEDCVVCHGGVDNLTGAPPKDLDDNRSTTAPGVGAHSVHLEGDSLTVGFDGATCHVVPSALYVPGHVDSDLPAEVIFSSLALTDTANAQWDFGNLTCNNTYCHGNWSLSKEQSNNKFIYTADNMEGNAASPRWTDPATATCGTCHGLPPKGHLPFDLTACTTCHGAVIDGNGTIIDRAPSMLTVR